MSEPTRIVSRNHLRAAPDGKVDLRVSGCGPAGVCKRRVDLHAPGRHRGLSR